MGKFRMFLAALAFLCPTAAAAERPAENALRLESFNFDPASPLEDRIGAPPEFFLDWLRREDGARGYKAYKPSPEETRTVRAVLAALPAKMRDAFRARLVGIYFVENLSGNGESNIIPGPDGKNYAWTVLNPTGLSRTVSRILSDKEDSLFKRRGTVSVDCGAPLPGVYYTLPHEGTHVYNYVTGVTPYVNPYWYKVFNGTVPPAAAPWDVWDNYDRPAKRSDFGRRNELWFYAPEGEGNFTADDAAELYSGLRSSPFMSLYGSQNWSEDIAEQAAYSFLKRETGRPCAVKYPAASGAREFVPGKRAAQRAELFYRAISR